MDLILIRHARPEQLELKTGAADPNLTALGHRQALAMASWLSSESIDQLYVSPMARARQTAEPLERILDTKATVVEGVREFDATSPTYIPVEVIRQNKDKWRKFLANEAATDRTSFNTEVVESLEKIVADNRGRRVAVVCHGGVINTWACHVLGTEMKLFFNPNYTSINRFAAASSGERSVISLNETAHLRNSADLMLYST